MVKVKLVPISGTSSEEVKEPIELSAYMKSAIEAAAFCQARPGTRRFRSSQQQLAANSRKKNNHKCFISLRENVRFGSHEPSHQKMRSSSQNRNEKRLLVPCCCLQSAAQYTRKMSVDADAAVSHSLICGTLVSASKTALQARIQAGQRGDFVASSMKKTQNSHTAMLDFHRASQVLNSQPLPRMAHQVGKQSALSCQEL